MTIDYITIIVVGISPFHTERDNYIMNTTKTTRKPVPAPPPTGNIQEVLDRMISDAGTILQKLQGAPLGLISDKEPALHDILVRVRKDLAEAQDIWK